MIPVILLGLLPLVASSGEGNIHILEDDVAKAMKACVDPKTNQRQNRSVHKLVGTDQQENQYGHERRNTSDLKERMHVLNATNYDYEGYGSGSAGEHLMSSMPSTPYNRSRRGDPLVARPDPDQCLSQCIFANMQVVDARGMPREPDLWARIQAAVTSQQSRAALRDQLRACFQELQSESDDDGCSYSDKIEHCMMFRFADRKPGAEPRA